jgi:cation diffusion facilitator family transporter
MNQESPTVTAHTGSARVIEKERSALRLSIWAALIMASLGFVFAFLTSSQVILLDGIFSLLGCALAVATLHVAGMVLRPDDEHFPFGYTGFESLLNLVKGLAIGLVSIIAGYTAIESLFHGGREIAAGGAALYGCLAAMTCFVFWWVQHRAHRATGSPLLEVDAKNWLVDGAISTAVALGFVAAVLLETTRYSGWVPYIDPILVLVVVGATVSVPFGIIRTGLGELLLATPPLDNIEKLEAAMGDLLASTGTVEHVPRLVRRGRAHYLNLYLIVDGDSPLNDVRAQDRFRARAVAALSPLLPNLVIDLIVTRERHWALEGSPPAGTDS